MTYTVHAHMGYKPWAARITGTNPTHHYTRDFLRAERKMSSSGKSGNVTFTITEPGVYQIGGTKGENNFLMLRILNSGAEKLLVVGEERVNAIAKLMDGGMEFEAARVATIPQGNLQYRAVSSTPAPASESTPASASDSTSDPAMTTVQLGQLCSDIKKYRKWLCHRGMDSLSLEATTLILRLVNEDITALATKGEVTSR